MLRCIVGYVGAKDSKDRSVLNFRLKQTKKLLTSRIGLYLSNYNSRQYAIGLDFTTFKKEKEISKYLLLYSQVKMGHSVGVNLNMFELVSNG